MIPLPDWSRLRPYPLPRSSSSRKGGCSDFSGCILGCGGLIAFVVLTLNAFAYGVWAGLGTLIALGLIVQGLSKIPRIVSGLVLGSIFAVGVWISMKQDHWNEPGWMAFNALLVLGLFTFAGYWEQKYRS